MAGLGTPANGGALDIIFDGEVPRTFTGRARTVISGGQFVTVSGAANVIGSTIADFITGSIVVGLLVDSNHAVGIALKNTGSNQLVTVATRGTFITTYSDAISGGVGVYPVSGTIQSVASVPSSISFSGTQVGRAITAGASGTNLFGIVNFNF